MLDLSKPIKTRDGSPVRILCTDATITSCGERQPIVGIVGDVVCSWDMKGTYNPSVNPSDMDLVNVPPEKIAVNVEVRVCIIDGKRYIFAAEVGDKFGTFGENPVASTTVVIEYEPQT